MRSSWAALLGMPGFVQLAVWVCRLAERSCGARAWRGSIGHRATGAPGSAGVRTVVTEPVEWQEAFLQIAITLDSLSMSGTPVVYSI